MFASYLDYDYNDFSSDFKAIKQSNSLKATKEKRKDQRCKVFEIKVRKNKLNKTQLEHLNMIFVEAKWIYNDILNDITNCNENYVKNLKEVKVKYPNGFINKEISYISSQMKQSIVNNIKNSLRVLSKLKKNYKVGCLKFLSEYKSIDLKQFNVTYKIKGNSIKLQGLSKPIKVSGLDQIKSNYDIANAKIVKRLDDFYFYITTYFIDDKERINEVIGIDLGKANQLNLSNKIVISYQFSESENTKRLAIALSNKDKGSKSFIKTKNLLRKSYIKDNNRKKDCINKIFHYLDNYKYIAIQDDDISSWKKTNARTIQYSSLGAIKSKLKSLESSRVDFIDRFVATTKICCNCGNIKDMSLKDRVYKCPICHLKIDRDLNSAYNMIKLSKFVAMDRSKRDTLNNKDLLNISIYPEASIRSL